MRPNTLKLNRATRSLCQSVGHCQVTVRGQNAEWAGSWQRRDPSYTCAVGNRLCNIRARTRARALPCVKTTLRAADAATRSSRQRREPSRGRTRLWTLSSQWRAGIRTRVSTALRRAQPGQWAQPASTMGLRTRCSTIDASSPDIRALAGRDART